MPPENPCESWTSSTRRTASNTRTRSLSRLGGAGLLRRCIIRQIVFADEYGTWMIPVDEKQTIGAYLVSLAAISTPEPYAAAAMPLIRRDSFESFTKRTYAAAIRAADKARRRT